MGKPIKQLLRGTPPTAIATYDYFDIAEGTGIIEFEAFYARDRTASYALLDRSSNVDFSRINSTLGPVSSWAFAKTASYNFDSNDFNTPRIIKGNAFVKLDWSQPDDTNNQTHSGAIVAHIKKVSNSNETTLGTASGVISVFLAGGGIINTSELFKISIPQTNFKIGDKLRLGIDLWSATATIPPINPAFEPSFYHNPATSQALLVKIPFRLTDL